MLANSAQLLSFNQTLLQNQIAAQTQRMAQRSAARAESQASTAAPTGEESSAPASASRTEETWSAQYSEMRRLAMSASWSAVSGGDDASGGQMMFSFAAESEQLVQASLSQSTQRATSGMDGASAQRLTSMSQQVGVRFRLQASVQFAFARTTEALAGASGTDSGNWMSALDGILANPDDAAGLLLQLLDKMFEEGEGDIESTIQDFLDQINKAFRSAGIDMSATGMQLEFEFEYSESAQVTEQVQSSDPLTLDLNGDGVSLSHYSQGASFDITGTGRVVTTAFVTGGDAFLAMDRNGNGAIDSGRELFGDQRGAANGFEELARVDSNRDGLINSQDASYGQLRLFRDNGNGRTEQGELMSLLQAGIAEINLRYANVSLNAAGDNKLAQVGQFRRTDGTTGQVADALLNYRA